MDTNKTACNCHNVRYQKIIDAVKAGADTFEKLQEMTGSGTGCGQCRDFVEHFQKEILENKENIKKNKNNSFRFKKNLI